MTCKNCNKEFSPDEIDSDGTCYDCANADPDYKLDTTSIVKELVENTMHGLAAAKKVSTTKIMSDFVAEHVYNNPDKYIEEVVSQASKKKKNDAGTGN